MKNKIKINKKKLLSIITAGCVLVGSITDIGIVISNDYEDKVVYIDLSEMVTNDYEYVLNLDDYDDFVDINETLDENTNDKEAKKDFLSTVGDIVFPSASAEEKNISNGDDIRGRLVIDTILAGSSLGYLGYSILNRKVKDSEEKEKIKVKKL